MKRDYVLLTAWTSATSPAELNCRAPAPVRRCDLVFGEAQSSVVRCSDIRAVASNHPDADSECPRFEQFEVHGVVDVIEPLDLGENAAPKRIS